MDIDGRYRLYFVSTLTSFDIHVLAAKDGSVQGVRVAGK
jgi:hypothetical protein